MLQRQAGKKDTDLENRILIGCDSRIKEMSERPSGKVDFSYIWTRQSIVWYK
jgi:hypothetical protein